jgi:hypothetical protein
MIASSYALQGQARIRVAARVAVCAMPAFHVTPVLGWSYERTNRLGSTTKPGAPPG